MSVSLIKPAAEDLQRLSKKNLSLTRVLVKKLIFISAAPSDVGVPLSGPLASMRKLKVGDRIWRIVWKVIRRKEVEVWGIGKRDRSEVYKEVERRIQILGAKPETVSLAELLASLRDRSIPAIAANGISSEIIKALHTEMGLSISTILTLQPQEAESLYERYVKTELKKS